MACLADALTSFRRDSLRPTTTKETSTLQIILAAEKVQDTIAQAQRDHASAATSRADNWARDAATGKWAAVHREVRLDDVPEAAAHGFVGVGKGWARPLRVTDCDVEARPGYDSMAAHEYTDAPDVLRAKVRALAALLRRAEACVCYTGAGISTASGIGDYATKAGIGADGTGRLRSPFEAQPTRAHRVLVALHRAGHLRHWVQQNHDGLPQKAGMPQSAMNEIHGAWYDVSNPVVMMSGALRDDLFADLLAWEQRADLVLALGTSLCGMNADRIVTTCARKARGGGALGSVIVSLQRTRHDGNSALRIFAKLEDVFALLAEEMALPGCDAAALAVPAARYAPDVPAAAVVEEDVFRVPYDATTGRRLERGAAAAADGDALPVGFEKLWSEEHSAHYYHDTRSRRTSWVIPPEAAAAHTVLDLREGAKLRVTAGMFKGDVATVTGKDREGHYRVQVEHQIKKGGKLRAKVPKILGTWFVEAAVKGAIALLPVVPMGDDEAAEE